MCQRPPWERNLGKSIQALNFGYDVTYASAYRLSGWRATRTDCRGGGREAGQPLGTGVFGQFSLAGLHLATRIFLAGNHVYLVNSNGMKIKEQKRA